MSAVSWKCFCIIALAFKWTALALGVSCRSLERAKLVSISSSASLVTRVWPVGGAGGVGAGLLPGIGFYGAGFGGCW